MIHHVFASRIKLCCLLALTLLLPSLYTARAETIEVPEEELATESVLPVFDKTVVVRERTVKTAKRFEAGGGAGLNLVEPLYEQMVFNITASYYFDELHGVNISGLFLSDGLSDAGLDLQAGRGLTGRTFDASLAPTVQSMLFANYQFSAYYGKISLTKQKTMNLSLYGTVGGGLVNWSDATTFGLDAGVGQKIYFTPNVGLRVDLMLAMYTGPDPTSPKTGNKLLNGTSGTLDSDQFESTFYFRPFLTGALVVLF
jgi:outer membrane beta-barrel protein